MILLTGATGYVGGRLLERLQAAGHPVRCLARHPAHLVGRFTGTGEVVRGDVTDPVSLGHAMEKVQVAFYLVHSMSRGDAFHETDRRGAFLFSEAARAAGVRRIIYLGGLGQGENLSSHLRSRQEVGRLLRESGVPTLELRASIIIGSGSLSFEMIRALVEKLPLMITPRWVRTRTQPIAIEDVVSALEAAIGTPLASSEVIEIGGADQVSYADLLREYARQRGLRRWMIRVPALTPRLSGLWLGLVTPVYARVGRELVEGLRNETVVRDPSGMQRLGLRPRGMREAIHRALRHEDRAFAATRWSDAWSSANADHYGGRRYGSRLADSRSVTVPVPPARAFAPIERLGGDTGWYHGGWLWKLRGAIDLVVGGAGMRRGRRDPRRLRDGDTLDFWRVERIEPGRMLRLAAEMRLPGRAWLQFEVDPGGDGSVIRQTALFDPAGLSGLLYWYTLWPVHELVFSGLLRGIARAAMEEPAHDG
jgi:uncharacterized protein YbjT (DUF2867 family)